MFWKDLKTMELVDFYTGESHLSKIYNVRIQSPFVLVPTQVKEKLGIGYKVLEVSVENDIRIPEIKDTVSASEAIVKTGYKALARAFHPDLNIEDTTQVMATINKAKKELLELLEALNGNTI